VNISILTPWCTLYDLIFPENLTFCINNAFFHENKMIKVGVLSSNTISAN